jgi:alanyl-tRNA synthetase
MKKAFERLSRKITNNPMGDFTQENKHHVAYALGFLPADEAAFLYDTYGLSPIDMIGPLKRRGLKMDWSGFEYEMAKRGADVSGLVREGRREETIF